MTALVTGATGFIGGQLCRRLVSLGFDVRALHRATSDRSILAAVDVEWALGDLLDYRSLVRAATGCDSVFHCGGLVARWQDPRDMGRSHTSGTLNMLQAAKLAGVSRFVHVSSVAALGVPRRGGNSNPAGLIDESQIWNYSPRAWPYGYAKHQAEMCVLQAVAAGLDAVIVSPSIVLGAGDVHRADDSVVELTARRRLPPIAAPGGLNWIHIDDTLDGIVAAYERGARGARYILGAENLPIREFLRRVGQILGVERRIVPVPAALLRLAAGLGALVDRLGLLPVPASQLKLAGLRFYYDMSQAERRLGFHAQRSLSQAVLETHAWFQQWTHSKAVR